MKNKFFKSLALALSFATVLSALPVNAYELDSQGMSIESVEYQNSEDEDFVNASEVFAEIGSTYQVTIPKVIVLSGESKSAEYHVSAEGDIAGYETIFVRPDRIVNLYSVNKDMQVGTITQDKTGWTNNTIDVIGNGLIEANGITAGKWTGTFNFNIELNRVLGDVIDPEHIHNPGEAQAENLVKPTCIEPGSYDEVVYCTDCFSVLSRETKSVPATGHKAELVPVQENRIEPGCITNGSIEDVFYCEVCGAELLRTVEPIRFLGHDFVDGYCSRCNIAEHEHVPAAMVFENEVAPDETGLGSHDEVIYCEVCGQELSRVNASFGIEQDFAYTGSNQTFTVPYDGLYKLEAWGGQGGFAQDTHHYNSASGGAGGYASGYIVANAGDVLTISVGKQGNARYEHNYNNASFTAPAGGNTQILNGSTILLAGNGGKGGTTGCYFPEPNYQKTPRSTNGAVGNGTITNVPAVEFNGTTYSPSTQNGAQNGNGKAKITLISTNN